MLRKVRDVLRLYTPARTELGVVEAAELLGRPTSTVSRWLSAMGSAGFLDRDPASGRYRLGVQLIGFGELARQSTFVQRLAIPALHEITRRTQETSALGVLIGQEAFDAAVVESPQVIRPAAFPGRRYPLHPTAVGKALLAWSPPREIAAALPRTLARYTPATITDPDVFLEELERTRERGYSVAWGEWVEDHAGLAAPIRHAGGNVIAALALAAPISRVSEADIPELGGLLVGVADGVTRALDYDRVAT